jgi:hypothetical protein
VAVGSSSLARDALHRLSSNKAFADVELPPTFPSVLLFSLAIVMRGGVGKDIRGIDNDFVED